MPSFPLLSLAIWLPIGFGALVWISSADTADTNAVRARWLAVLGASLGLMATLPLISRIETGTAALQFVEQAVWIERFNSWYRLGIDGLSLWLVNLTALITLIVVIAGLKSITRQIAQYLAAVLILSGLMIGVFCAQDGLLFYAFFEATLIPMYLIIGVWGGPNRVYAAFKFFLYTLSGSLLMLIALLYLYTQSGSFELADWQRLPLPMTQQLLLFGAFFIAFAVKIPMWPVHTWLPDAHVEAPTGGSVVLAAIMLKLGAYGFLRFPLPITPDASRFFAPAMLALSLIAVIYIGFVALAQTDMKKLVAYSSISHMGFVTLGLFIFNPLSIEGALVQMIAHGLVSGAMFLSIGVLYDRMHTRLIADYGGVVNTMPKFVAFMVLFAMANCGLPGTSNFVGEWMVILAAVGFNFWLGLAAASTLILSAAYTLWMVKRALFGAIANERVAKLTDIDWREFLLLSVLTAGVLLIGLYPKPLTEMMHAPAIHLYEQIMHSKLPSI